MKHKVLCGADVLARDGVVGLPSLGKCGLITNPTGVRKNMTATADMLKEICDLVALFGPEHGVRGDAQAGAAVEDFVMDKSTGIPAYSFYGKGQPQAETVMAELDTVFFDIQDVGARFYTYQYTMTDAMCHCAKHGVRFMVLDRPNPIGGVVAEGTILDRRFSTFVGRYPTPTRPGLTIGEFARWINESEKIGCDLHVIPCEGWTRDMDFDDTDLLFVQPSPNLPTVDTAYSYIGTCIFEGTNLSEGRGTTKPFEMIGAPWLDNSTVIRCLGEQPGVYLREAYFTPTFSKYAGELCHGIQLHVYDRQAYQPFATGLRLFCAIREQHPEELTTRSFLCNLLGNDAVLQPDFDVEAYIQTEADRVAEWRAQTKKVWLYE